MDNKMLVAIAAAIIAVLMFKPDLLSNVFKNTQQGGGGGSDTVIVPPVISQPSYSTYYDVNVGAPTFPGAPINPMGQGTMPSANSGGGGSGHYRRSGFTATRAQAEQMATQPIPTETSAAVARLLTGLKSCEV